MLWHYMWWNISKLDFIAVFPSIPRLFIYVYFLCILCFRHHMISTFESTSLKTFCRRHSTTIIINSRINSNYFLTTCCIIIFLIIFLSISVFISNLLCVLFTFILHRCCYYEWSFKQFICFSLTNISKKKKKN